METRATGRYHFLDALRGLAALAVLLAHVVSEVSPAYDRAAFSYFQLGNFGVLIFFLVSGFIIPRSLERGGLGAFWAGRLFRLYPLYLAGTLALLILLALDVARPILAVRVIAPDLLRAEPALMLASNLLPIQEFFGLPKASGVYWTLAFELLFYALLSLAYMVGWHRRNVSLAVGALLMALIIEGLPAHLLGSTLPRHGTLVYVATMFVGTVAYRWVRGEVGPYAALGVGTLAIIVLSATIPPSATWLPASPSGLLVTRLLAVAVFGGLLLLRHRRMPAVMLWLGRISYSLYLLHICILAVLPRTGLRALDCALWIVISLGLATLTERWIERPGIALGKRLTTRVASLSRRSPSHPARPLPITTD